MGKSNNTNNLEIVDDKNVILSEYSEVRKEILQFQDFQNKMIFGLFTFYIGAGTFFIKILADNNTTFNKILEDEIFISWLFIIFILFNLVIAGAFLAFNFTIGRASKYITGVLRYRFSKSKGRKVIFSWEDFYSADKIAILTETLPGTICIFTLYFVSFALLFSIWDSHSDNLILTVSKYTAFFLIIIHLSLLIYWIITQIIKPIERRKKINNT